MSKILVDECPAGPEMDAAVAEVLTGHSFDGIGKIETRDGTIAEFCRICGKPKGYHGRLPYSTDIAAAWPVHRAACAMLFSKRRLYFEAIQEQTRLEDGSLVVWPDVLVTLADIFPEAICRAFLKVSGIEHVEMLG